ncbi:MAG: hypothetical protein H6707_10950 [Deltaproteobacteria bacterium]|nr:hypothetical protein [Deltaproteobacteria bacterium]
MSASAVGVGRLLSWERFAVGFRTAFAAGIGRWDSSAHFARYGDNYAEHAWRSEFWSMVAISERASAYLRLPWALNYKQVGNLGDGAGGGLGDIQAGLRYEAVEIGEFQWFPAIALTLGVSFPSGRATDQAQAHADALGTSVTGRGAWAINAGVSLEKTKIPWFVRVDLGIGVPLPRDTVSGQTLRFGPQLQTALTVGREVLPRVVVSVYGRLQWESAILVAGVAIDNSSRADSGVGAACSWRFDSHWTAQLAIDSSLAFDGLGDNQPAQLTSTIGLRYGYF